ncbi:HAD-IIB family hydrolase [Streptomyces fodineus]|uniref:HAD-IIB family hydrolase n=1 Tax=Streptomyces fodineus TaxID=1904616 RepID=UPI001D054A0D|nr:HAD-IIB family hydrolase [Streptomyces fodineus]
MGDTSGLARVLVTDLDGTLLEGDASDRRRLRDVLKQDPDITLVFATGRGLASVQQLLRDDPLVPPARWIIADVGASVIDAVRTVHLEALEARLRAGWPGAHRVRAALKRFPQLVYQEDVSQESRCSFYLDPEGLSDDLTAAVKELGCAWSYASGRYFDVLPAGASKGRALHLLGHRLGWDRQAMLVAGDSLNDLSLFCLGTHAVVVANAEPALAARAPASARIHLSGFDGAAAVLEGMQRLGWLPRWSVVIGYHRPPVRWLDGAWQTPSSPNGILPTLRSALTDKRMDAVWAAAHTGEAAPPAILETVTDGLPLSLLPLRPEQWQGYFHRVCKETLWPALMSQPHLIQDRSAHWADYEQVNAEFARHISSLAAQNGTVWLHDYNLWLVPAALRAQRPDLTLGLFHHTPFPRPEVFRRIPAAAQLLDSLRHLHWAGFHTSDCADNFRRLLADTRGPVPRTGVHPLGIDRTAVADLARERAQPHPRHDRGQLVLSVERLDYAKAPVHKIRALDDLLSQTPRLRGQVRFRLVCPPPEDGIHAYDSTRRELETAIARINSQWASRQWQPVDYIPHNLNFPEVVDHYLAADVFWVTSLADGMNLTAQEYITTHHATNRPGVLILSRHTGIAQHLGTAALLTDPLHPHDLVDTLRTALNMSTAERLAHITHLAGLLDTPPPAEWAHTIITAIRSANSPHTP